MSHPAYTQREAQSRQTFLALMWSLSYPGRIHNLYENVPAFDAISEALLDIETSFYTSDESLITTFSKNGAKVLTPDRAAYHFYPHLTSTLLDTVTEASIGTLMYPDQSATLIIGATLGTGQLLSLSGPGINPSTPTNIKIAGIPSEFWILREKAIHYPRGWDIYFVDDKRVLGIPRTTTVVVEE
ncbi:MAG: phosphonate C-P lyase system protein PhnH [Phototrophicaceae bacterium]